MIAQLGPNVSGRQASLIAVNSEEKTVRGHRYKTTGVKELTGNVSWLNPRVVFCLLPTLPPRTSPTSSPKGRHEKCARIEAGVDGLWRYI